ncbi:uncharacterized protein CLUP02_03948 [Colletotrichum lupini]|uniref:Uncharacterized protein n=1 Tax=Colletotrichum lupini TaxID=145971 RepID=A0A9Q8WCU6_9PEZI|nr:uncharacterized protein CLUP02_03948 [Colletotrichum lupini]UQC78471.1 hypothetical protein CLUP02_03948 [Colletotrichum lupini]
MTISLSNRDFRTTLRQAGKHPATFDDGKSDITNYATSSWSPALCLQTYIGAFFRFPPQPLPRSQVPNNPNLKGIDFHLHRHNPSQLTRATDGAYQASGGSSDSGRSRRVIRTLVVSLALSTSMLEAVGCKIRTNNKTIFCRFVGSSRLYLDPGPARPTKIDKERRKKKSTSGEGDGGGGGGGKTEIPVVIPAVKVGNMNGTLNGKRQASSSTYLPCLDAWVTSSFLSILFLIHLPFSFPASPCSPAAPASPVVICVSCGRRAGLDLAAFRRKLHRFPSLPPTSNHNTITDFKATAETQALNHNVVNTPTLAAHHCHSSTTDVPVYTMPALSTADICRSATRGLYLFDGVLCYRHPSTTTFPAPPSHSAPFPWLLGAQIAGSIQESSVPGLAPACSPGRDSRLRVNVVGAVGAYLSAVSKMCRACSSVVQDRQMLPQSSHTPHTTPAEVDATVSFLAGLRTQTVRYIPKVLLKGSTSLLASAKRTVRLIDVNVTLHVGNAGPSFKTERSRLYTREYAVDFEACCVHSTVKVAVWESEKARRRGGLVSPNQTNSSCQDNAATSRRTSINANANRWDVSSRAEPYQARPSPKSLKLLFPTWYPSRTGQMQPREFRRANDLEQKQPPELHQSGRQPSYGPTAAEALTILVVVLSLNQPSTPLPATRDPVSCS